MTDKNEFDPVNDQGQHCNECSWFQASQESLTECMRERSKLADAAYAIFKAPFPLHDFCTKEQWEFACRFVAEMDKLKP